MTQHAISVVPIVPADRLLYESENTARKTDYRWQCRCGAQGDTHETHQRAFEFGSQHLAIEREGGQA